MTAVHAMGLGLDGVESFREGRVVYGRPSPHTYAAFATLREIVLKHMELNTTINMLEVLQILHAFLFILQSI